jgi:hypothetical protein
MFFVPNKEPLSTFDSAAFPEACYDHISLILLRQHVSRVSPAMMMVLSGLLKSSNELAPRRFGRSKHSASGSTKNVPVTLAEASSAQEHSAYLVDESQLAPVDFNDPDLHDLNN